MKRWWVVFFGILFLLFLYTGFKFTQVCGGRKIWGWLLAVGVYALMFASQFMLRTHADQQPLWFMILSWAGGLVIAAWATFVLLNFPLDVLAFARWAWGRVSNSPFDGERRALFMHWLPVGVAGASALMTAAGLTEAMWGPVVKEVTIPIKELPPELENLTIAQFSDTHVSTLIHRDYMQNVVNQITNLNADLIVMTGDLADGTLEGLNEHLEPISQLKAPLGMFYITGNHEYYWHADVWIEKMQKLGFTPLINENRVITHKGASFLVGGVTDLTAGDFIKSHKSDPVKAMGDQKGKFALNLLLAHQPESCYKSAKAGWNLQLSGHTHAGQFFPFNLLMPLVHRYYKGLYNHEGMWLYVNQGTGFWGPPDRLGRRAEISFFKITRA